MSGEALPQHCRNQLALFTYASHLAMDEFCPGADDGWQDVMYYYNQGDKLAPKKPESVPPAPVMLIPDNVVELFPQRAA